MHWFTAESDTVLKVYTEKRRHGLIPPFFLGKSRMNLKFFLGGNIFWLLQFIHSDFVFLYSF